MKQFKGPKRQRGFIAGLGPAAVKLGGFLSNNAGGIGGLLSGLFGAGASQAGIDQIQNNIEFNPFSGTIGGAGRFGPGGFTADAGLQAGQQGLLSQLGLLGQGGFAGTADFQNAIAGGGGITGAMSNANNLLNQQANPFFNQANFAGNMQNIGGLGNIFANNVAQGPQDFSGGAVGGLLSGGMNAFNQAGNTGGLVQQNLDASRALAAPQEERLFNQFANREFMGTRGATSGAQDRQNQLLSQFATADNQRIMNAQQLGQGQQGLLQQLGGLQMQNAQGLQGLNLQGFGQQMQGANQFAQLGLQGENQGFQQMLQSLGQNQSAGQQRIQNMMGLLGFGQNQQFGGANAMSQLFGGLLDLGNLGIQGQTGFLNAEANRIGATGMSNQAIADLAGSKGGFLGGLF